MNGYGILYYEDQRIAYEGEWKDDMFSGKGSLYNECVEMVSGEVLEEIKEGFGQVWVRYEGDFVRDVKEGVGQIDFSNKEKIIGQFRGDKLNGICTYFKKDGRCFTGLWVDNVLKNKMVV